MKISEGGFDVSMVDVVVPVAIEELCRLRTEAPATLAMLSDFTPFNAHDC